MKIRSWSDIQGDPFPLGQSWSKETQSYNFALYSKFATQIKLVLFNDHDLVRPCWEKELDYLEHKTGRIWHIRVPKNETNQAKYYAFYINGPASRGGFEQHAFDPDKLAVDPYVKCIYFPPDFDMMAAVEPGSNAGKAPLGILLEKESPSRAEPHLPLRHESDMIIYEMHVRGFTMNPNSGVTKEKRGTYSGVIEKIPHLQDLGVTAVELMPVFQGNPDEGNYWGYNPLFFFAPNAQYANQRDVKHISDEFRAMVDEFHNAGIEVILDVVYNHTAEGNEEGPKFSLKLIDKCTYYMVRCDTGEYMNFSGTGNSLHCANRAVRRLIVDSMRYWVNEMGVDGFRFDLASVFSRNSDGSINKDSPPIFNQIASDPYLQGVRLIAEPWDIGAYQLGRAFRGINWWQWNGRYREAIQRFVRGDDGMVQEMTTCVYGSSDLFPDTLYDACRPYQSVNYITSHDGFTLYDLVSYNKKNNWANGENNKDGSDPYSWNCGWEGDESVPSEIMQLRIKQIKNFFCLLMVSNGTPMFRMGDEFGHTQSGNSNPYNQDNELTWLDWNLKDANRDIYRFMRKMIAFRKDHPSLSRSTFWRDDVKWYGVGPEPDWSYYSHSFAFCVQGASLGNADIYVMVNAYWENLTFEIQETGNWKIAVDTAQPSPNDIYTANEQPPLQSPTYKLQPRSIVILVR